MPNPTRDETKQAAEHCVKGDCTGCPFEQEKGNPCDTWFARAYLALREQVDTVTLPALKHYADDSLYFPRSIIRECHAKGVRLAPIYSGFGEPAKAAIKAIEEEEL